MLAMMLSCVRGTCNVQVRVARVAVVQELNGSRRGLPPYQMDVVSCGGSKSGCECLQASTSWKGARRR